MILEAAAAAVLTREERVVAVAAVEVTVAAGAEANLLKLNRQSVQDLVLDLSLLSPVLG